MGFFSVHKISSKLKRSAPKISDIINSLQKKGFKASSTHLSADGIRTNAGIKDVMTVVRKT